MQWPSGSYIRLRGSKKLSLRRTLRRRAAGWTAPSRGSRTLRGRKPHGQFAGEVLTEGKKPRPGASGKHPMKENGNAVKWTKLSCHDFVDGQVRLQLFALAYNLGNFLRRLALPPMVKHWSLIPTYVGTTGEADQDRREGRFAREIRHLPDGGSGSAAVALPCHPRTHSSAQATGFGAGMTAVRGETAVRSWRRRGRSLRIAPRCLFDGRLFELTAVATHRKSCSRRRFLLTRPSRSIVVSESVRGGRELETIWEISDRITAGPRGGCGRGFRWVGAQPRKERQTSRKGYMTWRRPEDSADG